ncbi:hypothetical protein MFLO_15027 [Listeria floridensis FSL S10-1187]|uniref:Major facilitator superfamily (MFS) profile domain-containing protein n=1 Tax=Listeria floridensis FSL S10-1187 TaxID=1265817 RepID=A0ABP3AWP9_9LIST|nr:hypothetical protein [Listeria floridensis]EUJ25650.1 hypothetical protein MFLO_15027 [Listeria floridensis FSL S10-1187]
MEPKGKFFMYAVLNATAFLPYMLFILAGNRYDGWLNGYGALIIFYVFQATGTFLFNAINRQLEAKRLVLLLLGVGIVGSILASLGSFSAVWMEVGAVLIGISSSMALPAYITLQYHERSFYGRKMSNKNYLMALLAIIIALLIGVLLVRYYYASTAFLFYGALLAVAFYFVRKLPDYQVDKPERKAFLIRPFLVFLFFSIIIFVLKEVRTTKSMESAFVIFAVALVGVFLFVCGWLYFLPRLKLEAWILYFSFAQGIATSFVLLYGTFTALVEKNFNFMMFGVYLPFFLATLLSIIVEPFVKKAWGEKPILYLYSLGIGVGLVFTVIPSKVSIGAGIFICGLFISMLGRLLNRAAYQSAAKDMQDGSLLLRSRWKKLGAICGQIILLFLLFVGSLFSKELSLVQVVTAFNGNNKMTGSLFWDFVGSAAVVACGIISLYFLGLRRYKKNVRN